MKDSSVSRLLLLPLVAAMLSAPLSAYAQSTTQHPAPATKANPHQAQIDAAQHAAEAWLALVDEEKYTESWKAAAPFLQAHFPEKVWDKRLDEKRKPIDPLVDRTLTTTQFRDQFPGLPPGEYVALVWQSLFGAKHQMLESVIMADDDGVWKTIGYAVQ